MTRALQVQREQNGNWHNRPGCKQTFHEEALSPTFPHCKDDALRFTNEAQGLCQVVRQKGAPNYHPGPPHYIGDPSGGVGWGVLLMLTENFTQGTSCGANLVLPEGILTGCSVRYVLPCWSVIMPLKNKYTNVVKLLRPVLVFGICLFSSPQK